MDDAHKRLEDHGRQSVPAADPEFVHQLESRLRVEHAARAPGRSQRTRVVLPRLIAAAAIAIAGIAGVAALTGDEPGVPVAVIEEPATPLDVAAEGGDGNGGESDAGAAVADATAVPNAAPDVPLPTTTVPPATVPTTTAPPTTALPTSVPSTAVPATMVPTTTVPVATPTVEPSPTEPPAAAVVPPASATPQAVATPVAAATAVPVPTPTTIASPTATPLPTPTADWQPMSIDLTCEARVVAEAVGIVCNWTMPESDRLVAGYELSRSRNGAEAEVVSRQRANAPTSYADRDVDFGDQMVYLVQGFDVEDVVIAVSVREIVMVPEQG